MSITEIVTDGRKILWVETAADFREALKRGMTVELLHELADQIGLRSEDVGTEEEIEAARNDPYD